MNDSSDQKNNLWILIPAYNEARKIQGVLKGLRERGYENILVVNDGSQDETEALVKNEGIEVLTLILNRGQGAALKAGLSYLAKEKNAEMVVTFDADGQHQPEDIEPLVAPLLKDEADIVLGSRFRKKTNAVPILRRVILHGGVWFTNLISNVHLTDTHNGLRALNRKALRKIKITHRGMEHASDIIDEMKLHDLRYQEIPVTILYTDYSKKKGQSSLNFIKMGLKIILKKLL